MKIDWDSFDRGVFLVNVLGIVPKEGKILIGRRDEDRYVKAQASGRTFGRGQEAEESDHRVKRAACEKEQSQPGNF